MSCFNLKASIIFWGILIFAVIALFSGEFDEAKYLFSILIVGILGYQIIRWIVRGVSGHDIQNGSSRISRELDKIEKVSKYDEELLKHIASKRVKKYSCNFCKKRFTSQSGLDQHELVKHRKSKSGNN